MTDDRRSTASAKRERTSGGGNPRGMKRALLVLLAACGSSAGKPDAPPVDAAIPCTAHFSGNFTEDSTAPSCAMITHTITAPDHYTLALSVPSMTLGTSLAGFRGQATDIEIHAREIMRARDVLNELYSKHTGQPVERIAKDTDRDNFMTAEDAKAYGIVDEVLVSLKKPRTGP